MTASHRYEDLLPEQFYEELGRTPLAYFAAGAMEEHGLHNPLGTDYRQDYEVCLRAAEITGGIVFPPVPFAPAGIPGYSRAELRRACPDKLFPPSLWISREACELLYTELLESLADLGFKACVALGGHYPADLLLQDLCQRHAGRIGGMAFWGGGTVALLNDDDFLAKLEQREPNSGGHGMMWETSLIMAIRPDRVELPRATRIQDSPLPSQLKGNAPESMARLADANVALGEELLARMVEVAVGKARELLAGNTP